MESVFPLRVYIEDTDAGGIVYYVNYLKFMERARTELLRSCGFEQNALQESGLIFVVHSLNGRYLHPARLDDELQVKTVLKALSGAGMLFSQTVVRGSDKLPLCQAEIRIVSVDAQTIRPVRLPKSLVAALADFVIER